MGGGTCNCDDYLSSFNDNMHPACPKKVLTITADYTGKFGSYFQATANQLKNIPTINLDQSESSAQSFSTCSRHVDELP